MSRSYKKSPICSDRPHGAKYWKRIGNKKVRKNKDYLPKGKKYKKFYNSWEIHDYISRWDKKQAINDYHNLTYYRNGKFYKLFDEFKNEKEFIDHYWKKGYFRK